MQKSFQNLNNYISKSECGGLNIESDKGIADIFDDSPNTVKSNAGDATMICSIKFKEKVNVTSIQVNGVNKQTNPSVMKCYVNKLDVDFSDISDIPCTQDFNLAKEIGHQMKVNIPKWKNVSELTIYFENEEAEQLEIRQVLIYGSGGSGSINIGDMKKQEDESYVPVKGSAASEGVFSLKVGETIEGFVSKNQGKSIFVDFHAKWCGPCKQLGPILCQKAAAIGALVLKVDVDVHKNIAAQNNISSIPVVHLYKNGERIKTMVGFQPQALEDMINMAI